MTTPAPRPALYPIRDFQRHDEPTGVRSEVVAGAAFPIVGGGERHNLIAGNVYVRLRQQARAIGCRVFFADMKLRIEASGALYYPDVMVVADPDDDHPQYKTAPCIVVEVMSAETQATDRREKRAAYIGVPSLQAYVMVDADVRQVDVLLRRPDGVFEAAELDEHRQVLLPCGGRVIGLTLDDVYDDLPGPGHGG